MLEGLFLLISGRIRISNNELWENARIAKNETVIDVKYDSLLATKNNWYTKKFTRRQYLGDFERVWMAYYLTDGKDRRHCSRILPDQLDLIKSYCIPKNQVSHNVYKPNNKYYYIIVVNNTDSLTNKSIHVINESFPMSKVFNFIKTGSAKTVLDIPLSEIDDFFTSENKTFYIYRINEDLETYSVELRPSES